MKVHLIDRKLATEMDDYPAILFQLERLEKHITDRYMYRTTD